MEAGCVPRASALLIVIHLSLPLQCPRLVDGDPLRGRQVLVVRVALSQGRATIALVLGALRDARRHCQAARPCLGSLRGYPRVADAHELRD